MPRSVITTGPFLLAEAGVLDDYRATCHWESLPGFRESYPNVQVEQALYVTDRDRMTCAGGAAAIDMMLDWIGCLLGRRKILSARPGDHGKLQACVLRFMALGVARQR